MRNRVLTVVVGIVFGFVLQRTGFASWDEVHKMFTFADLRLRSSTLLRRGAAARLVRHELCPRLARAAGIDAA